MPKLFSQLLISCFIFYSSGVFAELDQNTKAELLMADLNQIVQPNMEIIKEHDELLNSTVSDMEDCPYKDTWKHRFQSVFFDICNELVEKTQTEEIALGHVLIWFLKFEPDKSASKHHYSPEIPG